MGHNIIAPDEQQLAISTATDSGSVSFPTYDTIRRLWQAISKSAGGDDKGHFSKVDNTIETAAVQRTTDNFPDAVNVQHSHLDTAGSPEGCVTLMVSKESSEARQLAVAEPSVDAANEEDSLSTDAVAPGVSLAGETRRLSTTPTHDTSGFRIRSHNEMVEPEGAEVGALEADTPVRDSFVLITSPRLGFSNQGKIYMLGQPMVDVIRSYGLAEKVSDTFKGFNAKLFTEQEYRRAYAANTKTYAYLRRGMHVTSNNRGLFEGAFFHVANSWPGTPADILARFGDASGASLEEIIEAYGPPAETRCQDPLGNYDLRLDYEFQGDVLTFGFWREKLISITITRS